MGGVVSAVGGALFGSGDDEPEQQKTDRYTPSQMKLISDLAKLLSTQLGGGEEPIGVEPYPGQMYAGEQPLQSALFSFLSQAPDVARSLQQAGMQYLTSDQGQALQSQIQNVLGQTTQVPAQIQSLIGQTGLQIPHTIQEQAWGEITGYNPAPLEQQIQSRIDQNWMPNAQAMQQAGLGFLTQPQQWDPTAEQQYWEQTFVAPAQRQFMEETLPAVQEKYAGMGALDSSGFNRALTDAMTDMQTQLSGQLGSILYSGQQSYLDRLLQERGLGLSALGQGLGAQFTGRGQEMGALQNLIGQQLQERGLGQELLGQGLGFELSNRGQQLSALDALLGRQLQGQGQQLSALDALYGRQLQGRGLGLSALDAALAQIGMLPSAGLMQQQLAQQPLTEQYQQWAYQQPYNNPWLPLISPTLGAMPYEIDTVVPQPSTGLFGALAPGIGFGLGGMLGGLF